MVIATGSNNLLKAAYAVAIIGWKASFPVTVSLLALAAGAVAWALRLIAVA